jgi:hypothetical protein
VTNYESASKLLPVKRSGAPAILKTPPIKQSHNCSTYHASSSQSGPGVEIAVSDKLPNLNTVCVNSPLNQDHTIGQQYVRVMVDSKAEQNKQDFDKLQKQYRALQAHNIDLEARNSELIRSLSNMESRLSTVQSEYEQMKAHNRELLMQIAVNTNFQLP